MFLFKTTEQPPVYSVWLQINEPHTWGGLSKGWYRLKTSKSLWKLIEGVNLVAL